MIERKIPGCIDIQWSIRYPGYIWQREVYCDEFTCWELMVMDSAYSDYDQSYIGTLEDAQYLCYKQGLRQIQKAYSTYDPSVRGTIGFQPEEQKWYGWSHRAMYGFGIGSQVNRGDCGYKPRNKEEFVEDLCTFFEIGDGTWRECESPDILCVSVPDNIEYDVETEEGLGARVMSTTYFRGAPERNYSSDHIYPYPKVWGRGAWVAKTLKDAKEMAIDFSNGVS